MSWAYRKLVRPVLFTQDPEDVHDRTINLLARVSRWRPLCGLTKALFGSPPMPVDAFGLNFPNPIGLAAGMDKEGLAVPVWAAIGFGFSELGAVTRKAQVGNPRPRVFRAIPERSIVNRMGFNNAGAPEFARHLKAWHASGRWPGHPVGVNLGKSKVAPLAQAAEDYAQTLRAIWEYADFFVVNVSSPNTPSLRRLQDRDALDEILAALQEVNMELAAKQPGSSGGSLKPILVKVAPDLEFEALDEIVSLVEPRKVAGFVATNTTTSRPATRNDRVMDVYAEAGGLSGRPLKSRSTEVITHLYRQTAGRLPIIGVGGIFNAKDAWEKITAGARLIQLYTGLVYEGPGLPSQIVKGLRRRLDQAGFKNVREAVGATVKL